MKEKLVYEIIKDYPKMQPSRYDDGARIEKSYGELF